MASSPLKCGGICEEHRSHFSTCPTCDDLKADAVSFLAGKKFIGVLLRKTLGILYRQAPKSVKQNIMLVRPHSYHDHDSSALEGSLRRKNNRSRRRSRACSKVAPSQCDNAPGYSRMSAPTDARFVPAKHSHHQLNRQKMKRLLQRF
jgi:hypothetical protein